MNNSVTMTEVDIQERMEEVIRDLSSWQLVCLNNEYCNQSGYMDDYIYDMEEFDYFFSSYSPLELAEKLCRSDFDPSNDFYMETIYGVESFNDPSDHVSVEEIARYCIRNEEGFHITEVEDFLSLLSDLEEVRDDLDSLMEDFEAETENCSDPEEVHQIWIDSYADEVAELQARMEELEGEIADY